ncbi:acyl-ACP thioesterase domain-containing protein [Oscillospiraceae bacterium 52-8]
MYTQRLLVPEHQAGASGEMSLGYMMRNVQEVATNHFASQNGLLCDDKGSWKVAFFIANCHLQITRPPRVGEEIAVSTFLRRVSGAFFERDTEICSAQGEVLVQSCSNWFLLDRQSMSVLKPSECPYQNEMDGRDFPVTSQRRLRFSPDVLQWVGERTIRYTMIDANGHTNNAVYGDLAMDACWQVFGGRQPSGAQFVFNHQAKLGDRLQLFAAEEEDGVLLVGKIGDNREAPDSKSACFVCALKR